MHSSRHDDLAELLEELISACAIKREKTYLNALTTYERIINKNVSRYPEVSNLKWFEKRRVSSYYAQATTYENGDHVWAIIRKVMNNNRG